MRVLVLTTKHGSCVLVNTMNIASVEEIDRGTYRVVSTTDGSKLIVMDTISNINHAWRFGSQADKTGVFDLGPI